MKSQLKILLSNDDGVNAIGLATLYQRLIKQYEHVTVVAPDRNCSGMSHSLTLQNPLRVTQLENGFYSVNGTPADCINVAIDQLCEQKPDIVISGINHGANLGQDVIYSGTVAGAIEGFQLGVPSLAVSLTRKEHQHYDSAAEVICTLLERIKKSSKLPWDILNINVPDLPYEQLKGIAVTHLGKRIRSNPMTKHHDSWGRDIYWFGQLGQPDVNGPQADFTAIEQHYASVTPIQVDMTKYDEMSPLTTWINNLDL